MHALNAHPERMPTLSVPKLAKLVALIPTNPNPMLRNALQCKKGSTNPAQQPKSNVQRVKEETVVVQLVKNAIKEDFKRWRETPHVSIVRVDGVLQQLDRLDAFQYHRGRTHCSVSKPFANAVTLVPVQTHHERLVPKARTLTTLVLCLAYLVHRANLRVYPAVPIAIFVLMAICSPTHNNPSVNWWKLGKLLLKEGLPLLLSPKDLKLIH